MARRGACLLGGGRMRYLRLLWTFFRVGAMGELAYRANFFVQLLEQDVELERHPDIGALSLTVPDELFATENWWV